MVTEKITPPAPSEWQAAIDVSAKTADEAAHTDKARARQALYDLARSRLNTRQKQVKKAQQRYRNENKAKRKTYDKKRTKKRAAQTIIGVDGEGEDFYVCRRCRERTTRAGGPCPKGGMHVLTYACTTCGKHKAHRREKCIASHDGLHTLEPAADGHIYTYLAAVDEHGKLVAEAHNPRGLSHEECVSMLLRIPKHALKFGFMFSYDVTKIIEDMPLAERFYLMRPAAREIAVCKDKECKAELPRAATKCHKCEGTAIRKNTKVLEWNGRDYDFFHGSLTVSDNLEGRVRSTKVWDCFRFFGCAFVEALKNWSGCKNLACSGGLMARAKKGFTCVKCGKEATDYATEMPVATEEQILRISSMKDKRGAFDTEDPEDVKRYCREECYLLARMMRRLIDAHERAGIPLKRYDGAGSTATALLKKYNVAEYKGPRLHELEPELAEAVTCAFFGGRFEDSVVGTVKLPVHGYDISSAYPFALTTLPCLSCGFWRREKRMTLAKLRKIQEQGGLALCRFHVRHVPPDRRKDIAWCPLPFRSEEGSISYGTNFSGWSWGPEIEAALRGWSDLVRLNGDAWVYERRCDHAPFLFMPEVYRQRIEWGKEGAGIVLKLGMNAGYGKTAQSIGDNPPFQSWIWAGMITATTRGQLLGAIASAKNPWNVLAVATDGIFALEELPLKKPPYEVGTSDLKKPLGGWEYKPVPQGIFLAKPGLYYSLVDPKAKEEVKGAFVRARGVGRREVKAYQEKLEAGFAAWDRRNMKHAVVLKSRRFYGAKHSVYARSGCVECKTGWAGVPEQCCPSCGKIGSFFKPKLVNTEAERAAYGTWDVRTVNIRFDPHPKRERSKISRRGSFARLSVRDLENAESMPYPVGMKRTSPEGEASRKTEDFELEQPDWNSTS